MVLAILRVKGLAPSAEHEPYPQPETRSQRSTVTIERARPRLGLNREHGYGMLIPSHSRACPLPNGGRPFLGELSTSLYTMRTSAPLREICNLGGHFEEVQKTDVGEAREAVERDCCLCAFQAVRLTTH